MTEWLTLSAPTSEIRVSFPAQPQVGKMVDYILMLNKKIPYVNTED